MAVDVPFLGPIDVSQLAPLHKAVFSGTAHEVGQLIDTYLAEGGLSYEEFPPEKIKRRLEPYINQKDVPPWGLSPLHFAVILAGGAKDEENLQRLNHIIRLLRQRGARLGESADINCEALVRQQYAQLDFCAKTQHNGKFRYRKGPLTAELNDGDCTAEMSVTKDRLEVHNTAKVSRLIGTLGSIRANVCFTRGRYYYEVTLFTEGLFQIGWASRKCKYTRSEGVGDDEYGWAYDGYRVLKWHKQEFFPYGAKWKAGDVVGCGIVLEHDNPKTKGEEADSEAEEDDTGEYALDDTLACNMEDITEPSHPSVPSTTPPIPTGDASQRRSPQTGNRVMFWLNGKFLGVAYSKSVRVYDGIYPALSASAQNSCRVNFGAEPFRFFPATFFAENEPGFCPVQPLAAPGGGVTVPSAGGGVLHTAVTVSPLSTLTALLEPQTQTRSETDVGVAMETAAATNAPDGFGRTPLHYAAFSRKLLFHRTAHEADVDAAEATTLLVRYGGGVDKLDRSGRTPLHYAALRGRLAVTTALLSNGADAGRHDNAAPETGDVFPYQLPLHVAAASGNGHVFERLLYTAMTAPPHNTATGSNGVDTASLPSAREVVLWRDGLGNSCMHLAASAPADSGGSVITVVDYVLSTERQRLLQRAAARALSGNDVDTAYDLVMFALLAGENAAGFNPLHIAGRFGNAQTMHLLVGLAAGLLRKWKERELAPAAASTAATIGRRLDDALAELMTSSVLGDVSPLHMAATNGNVRCVDCLLDFEKEFGVLGKFSERAPADSDFGDTPLHCAAAYDNVDAIAVLIDKGGFDPDIRIGRDGETPLARAAYLGSLSAVSTLLGRGAAVDSRSAVTMATPLHRAVKNNHTAVVALLISHGADVNAINKYDGTPLLHALHLHGRLAVAQQLVAAGARVLPSDGGRAAGADSAAGVDMGRRGRAPTAQTQLYVALHEAKPPHVRIAAMLVAAETRRRMLKYTGVTASEPLWTKDGCFTPLHWAAWCGRVDKVDEYLAAHRPVDTRTKYDRFHALHLAAYNGHRQVFERLLGVCKSDLAAVDSGQRTPLHWAALRGHVDIVRLCCTHGVDIAVGGGIEARDRKGATPLGLAARNGQLAVARVLIEEFGARVTAEAMGMAAYKDHRDMLRLFVDTLKFPPPAAVAAAAVGTARETTADVVRRGLTSATYYGHEDTVKLLLTSLRTAAAKAVDADVLADAALRGHVAILKMLMEFYRANGNVLTPHLLSVLLLCATEGGTAASGCMALLLEQYGATVGVATAKLSFEEQTALHSACFHGLADYVDILLSPRVGGEPNLRDARGRTPLHAAAAGGYLHIARRLVDAGADIIVADNRNRLPIHDAASKGHLPLVRYFLELAPSCIDSRTILDATPLVEAATSGHGGIVTALLDAGADVTFVDNHGAGPLHHAASKGLTKAVKYLLSRGADPSAEDDKGETPLHWAAAAGHADVVRILIDAISMSTPATPAAETAVEQTNAAAIDAGGEGGEAGAGAAVDTANGAAASPKPRGILTPLHYALRHGDEVIFRMLLERFHGNTAAAAAVGLDRCVDEHGLTPLHEAASGAHFDLFKKLLDIWPGGVDLVNHRDIRGRSVLHWLVSEGTTETAARLRARLGRSLPEKRLPDEAFPPRGSPAAEPLEPPEREGRLVFVIERAAEHLLRPQAAGTGGTLLAVADDGRQMRSDGVRVAGYTWTLAARRYAEPSAPKSDFLALFFECSNVGAGEAATAPRDFTVFAYYAIAVVNQRDPSKSVTMESGNGFTARINGWGWKRFVLIADLFRERGFLENGALKLTVNFHVFDNEEILRHFVFATRKFSGGDDSGDKANTAEKQRRKRQFAKFLLTKIPVNDVSTADKWTPLHLAAEKHGTAAVRFVRLLLSYGADVNARDWRGRTPLDWAVAAARADSLKATAAAAAAAKSKKKKRSLLTSSAGSANALQKDSKMTDDSDTESDVDSDSDTEPLSTLSMSPPRLATSPTSPLEGTVSTDKPKTPLSSSMKIIKLLLRHGADVDHVDFLGATPLHQLVWYAANDAVCAPIVRAICAKSSASVHTQTHHSKSTPLHWAVALRKYDTAAALLDAGARPDSANAAGHTALHIALRSVDLRPSTVDVDIPPRPPELGPPMTEAQFSDLVITGVDHESDVAIVVDVDKDGHEQRRVRVRKRLLAGQSEFFRAMFSHIWRESAAAEVVLREVRWKVFVQVVRFLYVDHVDSALSLSVAVKLLNAADQLAIPRLACYMERWFQERVAMDTVAFLYDVAEQFELPQLKMAIARFFMNVLTQPAPVMTSSASATARAADESETPETEPMETDEPIELVMPMTPTPPATPVPSLEQEQEEEEEVVVEDDNNNHSNNGTQPMTIGEATAAPPQPAEDRWVLAEEPLAVCVRLLRDVLAVLKQRHAAQPAAVANSMAFGPTAALTGPHPSDPLVVLWRRRGESDAAGEEREGRGTGEHDGESGTQGE